MKFIVHVPTEDVPEVAQAVDVLAARMTEESADRAALLTRGGARDAGRRWAADRECGPRTVSVAREPQPLAENRERGPRTVIVGREP